MTEPDSSFLHSMRMVLLSHSSNEYIRARGHGALDDRTNTRVSKPDTSVWSTVDSFYVTFLAIINGSEGWHPNSSGGRLAKV